MGLRPCRECGNQVSTNADICPHCGQKNPGKSIWSQNIGCGGLLLLVILMAVCWGIIEDSTPPSESTSTPTSTPVVLSCLDVPRALLDLIESTLTVYGGGTIPTGKAVRSRDYERIFFVSVRIEGAGMNGTVATFATNRLDGTGVVYSVDGAAREFSQLGYGGTTQAEITMARSGARASQRCLQ